MILIMLGAPGTGKGTVAAKLATKLNIPQVSTGDIFRKAIAEKTPVGVEAEKYISQGMLVPDDITIKIVEERLKDADVQNGLILDGFPRTIEQAEALDTMLSKINREITLAINLETPEEEIIDRIVNRRVCSNQDCKTIYNLVLNPPKQEGICDKCGHELTQRKDDNVETVEARLEGYLKNTSPLVEYYEKKGNLHTEVVSKSINRLGKDVAEDIIKMFK